MRLSSRHAHSRDQPLYLTILNRRLKSRSTKHETQSSKFQAIDLAANAQGGGRCPCCRQLVHLLFHSVATFVNPEDESEKPQLVVQPMSVASLVDELGRQQQQQQQQRREQPGRHQTALNGPQRRLGAMTRRPAFPALRSSASVTFQSPMSPEGDRARWFDAGAVGGETMRVMFATTQERRNQSSGEVDEWTSGSDQD
jgi:hypothetical protein